VEILWTVRAKPVEEATRKFFFERRAGKNFAGAACVRAFADRFA
jgi:hypothetical protein